MQIFSCDNYFILGVRSLIETLDISDTSGMVVFDLGCQCVYIFNNEQLRLTGINDSFNALLYCINFLLPRNSILEVYYEGLKEYRKKEFLNATTTPLTLREEEVMKELCSEPNPKIIARKFNISEKTVSAHKIKGLRKLGVKNTITLHAILQAWNEVLPVIHPETPP